MSSSTDGVSAESLDIILSAAGILFGEILVSLRDVSVVVSQLLHLV